MNYEEFLERIGLKYRNMLRENGDKEFTYTLSLWEVGIFQGLVALAADHPGIEDMSPYTHQFIHRFREWCKQVWVGMGMTEEEADLLDRLREE